MASGVESSGSILALVARLDRPAKLDVEQLHSVTDTKNWHPKGLQFFEVNIRSTRLARALGPAGQNDRTRCTNLGNIFG